MWCSMFCLDGEVVFMHAKHVSKKVQPHSFWLSHVGNLKIASECTRTEHVVPPYLRLALGRHKRLHLVSCSVCVVVIQ